MLSMQTTRPVSFIAITFVILVGCGRTEPRSPRSDRTEQPSENVGTSKAEADRGAGDLSNDAASSVSDDADAAVKEVEWGNLGGRFVYDGDPPERKKLRINKHPEVCSKHQPLDESLVVNAENHGLANVAIYLYVKRGSESPAIHPSYQGTEKEVVKLNNLNCHFAPHVVLLRTSQSLAVSNSDSVGHNTKIDLTNNTPINTNTPPGQTIKQQIARQERGPSKISCSIHNWMTGWLVVRDNPYFAVTDENGGFEIHDLPAGEHTFEVWHEKGDKINKVTLNSKKETWKRGRFTFEIKPGDNDMGEIRVVGDLFK